MSLAASVSERWYEFSRERAFSVGFLFPSENLLTKPGLLIVCDAMQLFGMKNRAVADIRAAIRQKILDRRSGAQRAAMIQNERG